MTLCTCLNNRAMILVQRDLEHTTN